MSEIATHTIALTSLVISSVTQQHAPEGLVSAQASGCLVPKAAPIQFLFH